MASKIYVKGEFTTTSQDQYIEVHKMGTSVSGTLADNTPLQYLFYNQENLTDASGLICSVALTDYNYAHMFDGCHNLSGAPQLPATVLAPHCYEYMFANCKGLTATPELPATTLADYCYAYMFYNDVGLIDICDLPATQMKPYCYSHMFDGCSGIPFASSTTPGVATHCIPTSGTGVAADNWGTDMFANTQYALATPILNGNIYIDGVYTIIRYDSLDGNKFTVSGANGISNKYYTTSEMTTYEPLTMYTTMTPASWIIVRGNMSRGTDIVDSGGLLTSGSSDIKVSGRLASTNLSGLFAGDLNLTDASGLTLPADCMTGHSGITGVTYQSLFNGCKNLKYPCQLPSENPPIPPTGATTFQGGYAYMFKDCESLEYAPEICLTNIIKWTCAYMFSGCKKITKPVELKPTNMQDYCYSSMFENTGIKFSATMTEDAFRVPQNGSGTVSASNWNYNMFNGCDGATSGMWPPINTIVYLAPPPDPVNNFKFEGTNVTITKHGTIDNIEYSVDGGSTWSALTGSTPVSGVVQIRGEFDCQNTTYDTTPANYLEIGGENVKVSGKAGDGRRLDNLFYGQTKLVGAGDLTLSTTLVENAYASMFANCSNLIHSPKLPATTLTKNCYHTMFTGCTVLMEHPELPAKVMAEACYYQMFKECKMITTPISVSSVTTATNCFYQMYMNCSGIQWNSSATGGTLWKAILTDTGQTGWNTQMFSGNSGSVPSSGTPYKNTNYYLTTANEIILIESTDGSTFKLTQTISNDSGMYYWANPLGMGYNWSALSYNSQSPALTKTFVRGILPNATQTGHLRIEGNNIKISGKLSGQVSHGALFQTNTSIVDASELVIGECASTVGYPAMFKDCTNLKYPPVLTSTTMTSLGSSSGTYLNMFYGCTSLQYTPNLPATTLAQNCYMNMFYGCTSLTKPANLGVQLAGSTMGSCYNQMFYGCSNIVWTTDSTAAGATEYKIPASSSAKLTTWATSMFENNGGDYPAKDDFSQKGTPKGNTLYYYISS